MPTDRVVATVAMAPDEERSKHSDRSPIQYLSRAQEALNLSFSSADVVDNKLVMEYENGGSGVMLTAQRDVKKVAKMADRVAVVGFSDEGWGRADTFRVFRADYQEQAQLNRVKSIDGEDGKGGEDVLEEVEGLLGFKPVRNL